VRHINNGNALDWRSVDFVLEQSSLCAFDHFMNGVNAQSRFET